jgi:hypothetical protein
VSKEITQKFSDSNGEPQKTKWLDRLIEEAAAIEAEEAQKAGTISYMARLLAQATMPHNKTDELIHTRTNGLLTVTLVADPRIGLLAQSCSNTVSARKN